MPGVIVRSNEVMIRAGVGVRITTSSPLPAFLRGIFGYVGRANWGPLNTPVVQLSRGQIRDTYGTPDGVSNTFDGAEEAFNGGAIQGVTVRAGIGGTAGTDPIVDGAAAHVGDVTAQFVGTRALSYAIRAAADGSANKELVLYEGAVQLELFRFSTVGTQIDNLVAAVGANGEHSDFIKVTKLVNGDGTVANVAKKALPPGTNPTIDSTAYTNALTQLGTQNFFAAAFDTEDNTLHAAIRAWNDDQVMHGRRRVSVLGLSSGETWANRKLFALAHNNPGVVVVGNGFTVKASDGITDIDLDGYQAAARLAGAYTACKPNQQLTHRVIPDATKIVGPLTDDQYTEAKQSGLNVFGMSFRGRVWVAEGINTFNNAAAPPIWAESMSGPARAGDVPPWGKMRRVLCRFYLIDDVTAAWDDMIETSNNTDTGRAVLKNEAQSVVNRYIAAQALIAGQVLVDKTRQASATADEAFFAFDGLVDADGAERLILNAVFP